MDEYISWRKKIDQSFVEKFSKIVKINNRTNLSIFRISQRDVSESERKRKALKIVKSWSLENCCFGALRSTRFIPPC